MSRNKRKVPEINSSSMADISFLLLIFFLVTTTMVVNKGLARRLPAPIPPDQKTEDLKVKERNVLVVLLNSDNQLMVQREYISVTELRNKAKEFIVNANNADNMPEKTVEEVQFFGETQLTRDHVISLQNDRTTSYKSYIEVQNELIAAYNELREELAKSKFGVSYAELDDDRKSAIQYIYPQKISEAEPKNYGGQK
jgi:biopolymer transport protein ExbD